MLHAGGWYGVLATSALRTEKVGWSGRLSPNNNSEDKLRNNCIKGHSDVSLAISRNSTINK